MRRLAAPGAAGVDPTLLAYGGGLFASFAISHVDAIHLRLLRHFPHTYPMLNVVLPCGRALALLGMCVRAAELRGYKV